MVSRIAIGNCDLGFDAQLCAVAEKAAEMKERVQAGLITFGVITVVGLPIVLGVVWLVLWMGNR